MATGSKILRRNFALKIGSSKEMRAGFNKKQQQQATSFARSTSEMVKSYINGTYKSDSANSFWNELAHVKVASPREENKGPLKAMRSILNPSQPAIIPVTSAGGLSSLATDNKRGATLKSNTTSQILNGDSTNKARQASAVAAITANRRLLRNSNGCYKIISNRRFGSSASSSCGSIFKRHDDRRRVSSFKRTVNGGFIERLYNTQPSSETKSSLANISSSKYLMSLRNQNIPAPLGSVAEAVKVSTNIQQELMPIDKTIRERISLKNTFGGKAANPEPSSNTDPMSGWHHPPSPEKLSTTTRLSERLWYQRDLPTNQTTIPQGPASTVTSKADRSQSSIRSVERFGERRINSAVKLNEKDTPDANSRLRVARKPARLTLSCTPPPPTADNISPMAVASYSVAKRKLPPTQSASPIISACSNNALSSDDETQARKMIHMTARRINAVEHQPVRRFSLRRPPKADMPHITAPAPGPAAESLNLQNNRSTNSLSARASAMSTFADNVNPNTSRYRHFNNRPF